MSDIYKTQPKITVQELLAAGYSRYQHPLKKDDEGYIGSYQKRVDDAYGKRYFINFDHSRLVMPGRCDAEWLTPSGQMTSEGVTFDLDMVGNDYTLEQVEAFFAKMWVKMGCDYYENPYGDDYGQTKDEDLRTLADKIVADAEHMADVLRADQGDGLCITDLEQALIDLRGTVYEVEVVAGQHPEDSNTFRR
jgi:hypothetical protein